MQERDRLRGNIWGTGGVLYVDNVVGTCFAVRLHNFDSHPRFSTHFVAPLTNLRGDIV